jgi:hypothetical protein
MCINRIKAASQIEYKKKFELTQSVLPDECGANTEPRMKSSLKVYGIEVPEDEDQCEVTVLENKNKCVEVIRVNEERSESEATELNEEYQDNPIETAVGTTRSGARFREIAATSLYTQTIREIASTSGRKAFEGGYEQELGMHFDPGPKHDSIFCGEDDYG